MKKSFVLLGRLFEGAFRLVIALAWLVLSAIMTGLLWAFCFVPIVVLLQVLSFFGLQWSWSQVFVLSTAGLAIFFIYCEYEKNQWIRRYQENYTRAMAWLSYFLGGRNSTFYN